MADEQRPLLGTDGEDGNSDRVAMGKGIIERAAATTATTALMPPPLPQAIAHRGYKALAPENTMLAFRAAVDPPSSCSSSSSSSTSSFSFPVGTGAGAPALETDLHLSRDGVVVLSHDETLSRCFGLKGVRVRDRDWGFLRTLRTVRGPPQPMPRLRDLLEWLDEPGQAHVWVMLDIKRHDDAEELVRRTAETIASVPATQRPWSERITPCCWNAKYIRLCLEHLPGYRVTHVGHSTAYARELVDQVPGLSSVSLLRHALASPLAGPAFLRDMRARGVAVHAWTVNEEGWMEWCARAGLAGVVTDDPALFRDVCERLGAGEAEKRRSSSGGGGGGKRRNVGARSSIAGSVAKSARFGIEMLLFHLLLAIVSTTAWLKHGSPRRRVREELRG